MLYSTENILWVLLGALSGLNVRAKKMFGCYCIYCDNEPIGWLSGNVFGLKEVGLINLPGSLKRPTPGASVKEIPIDASMFDSPWLPQAVMDTAAEVKRRRHQKPAGYFGKS